MSLSIALTIGGIFAIVGTILSLILITPEKRRPELNKFFRVLADIFNFKDLLLEYIIKALYILSTLSCIFCGFFMLFASEKYYYHSESYALIGLLTIVLGPIAVRIVYEFSMMLILLTKNVIQINNKTENKKNTLNGQGNDPFSYTDTYAQSGNMYTQPQPQAYTQPTPDHCYCTKCGAPYDRNQGGCPNGCDNR